MFIKQLTLSNILSFGPDTKPLDLLPLNIFIGPNGAGKSNLIDVIDLLRNAPGNMSRAIIDGGGILNWRWKGQVPGAVSAQYLLNVLAIFGEDSTIFVIAHPTPAKTFLGFPADRTNRTVSRTDAPFALAVLTTERKPA